MSKILIVDDHEVLRNGVKRIFDKPPGTVTFGEASTPQEALRLAREQEWDVVVLDLSLRDRSGLDVLKELKASSYQPTSISIEALRDYNQGIGLRRDDRNYTGA